VLSPLAGALGVSPSFIPIPLSLAEGEGDLGGEGFAVSPRKILVTGGAGFIASHLVDRLVQEGLEVMVVDNLSTGMVQNLNPKAKFYELDIQDSRLAELFEQERPNVVNHHAAQMSVQASVRDPAHDAQVNILGTLNLLNIGLSHGVEKFVYASSGGAIYGEPQYLPCDEKHPIAPLSPYGASKYAAEIYLQTLGRTQGLNHTILRYGNIYGPRQDPYGEAGVVAIFAQRMLRGEPVTINGNGQQERDFCYVDDVVEANIAALLRGDGKAYNIGTGIGTSVNEIFALLKDITGYNGDPHHGPAKPGEVFKISLGCSRAAQELGWSPKVSLPEGLARTVEYFKHKAKVSPFDNKGS